MWGAGAGCGDSNVGRYEGWGHKPWVSGYVVLTPNQPLRSSLLMSAASCQKLLFRAEIIFTCPKRLCKITAIVNFWMVSRVICIGRE